MTKYLKNMNLFAVAAIMITGSVTLFSFKPAAVRQAPTHYNNAPENEEPVWVEIPSNQFVSSCTMDPERLCTATLEDEEYVPSPARGFATLSPIED